MSKRALGILISLLAFFAAIPHGSAAEGTKAGRTQSATKSGSAKKATAAKARKSSVRASRKKVSRQASKPTPARQARAASKRQQLATTPRSPVPVVAPILTAGEQAGLHLTSDPLSLKSSVAFVLDQKTHEVLFEKNAQVALPIASLTKLMTALIVVEAGQDLDEVLEVSADDIDRLKNSSSRLRVGTQMTRNEMLHLALMSSENRAASALGRHYPGGLRAFVAAMNARAKALGMRDTRFVDSTGLSSQNVASAQDLAKLALAAYRYPLIREYSTHESHAVDAGGYQLQYMNSNRLVRSPDWEIGLQKTGYISEAGRCLVMQARVDGRPVVMVFLDSRGKESRLGDAARVRKWLEMPQRQTMNVSAQRS
ncbi:MAG TPA: D-alanyl-D-alanine endopeptidase [Noviherbaspirillum sp.]